MMNNNIVMVFKQSRIGQNKVIFQDKEQFSIILKHGVIEELF